METVDYIIGEVKAYEFTIIANDAPVPVTGATPTLYVVDNLIELNNILTVVGTVTDGAAGEISFSITANNFKAADDYKYRIEIAFTSGDIEITDWGVWNVNK